MPLIWFYQQACMGICQKQCMTFECFSSPFPSTPLKPQLLMIRFAQPMLIDGMWMVMFSNNLFTSGISTTLISLFWDLIPVWLQSLGDVTSKFLRECSSQFVICLVTHKSFILRRQNRLSESGITATYNKFNLSEKMERLNKLKYAYHKNLF